MIGNGIYKKDDEEKIKDLLELSKSEFLKTYNYLSEEEYQNTLDKMWEQLGDVPLDETGTFIDDLFYSWKAGDKKDNIWHWFDERVDGGIGNRYFN